MKARYILYLLIATLGFTSCEEEITVDLPKPTDKIVVEGIIEKGLPPYVLLTKNSAFFGGIDLNDLEAYFIKGAKITVTEGSRVEELQEYSTELLQLLPEEERKALAAQFGFELDSTGNLPLFRIYTIALGSDFVGEVGKKYDLRIEVDGKVLTATTTIPSPVSFDSLYFKPHPNPDNDTLLSLYGRLKDPDMPGNYYRYFTRKNSGPWVTGFQTVFDDAFINGTNFPIVIPYGIERSQRSEDFDPDTFGYFKKGDTCSVKLCMIDKSHYNFWRTLEADRGSQGNPFGSFVVVKTNINGGIGVWGGYGSSIQTIVAPL
jgi:hypothetical protein